jgi:hypothetical protein
VAECQYAKLAEFAVDRAGPNCGVRLNIFAQSRAPNTMKLHKWRYPISALLAATLMIMLSSAASASITRRFNTTAKLVVGNLVSISTTPDTVVPATFSNLAALYGVVTEVGTGTVQVADTEVAPTLVSVSNGNINIGDPITASGLSGVGQKATTSTRVVGYAQADFTAKTKGATTQSFKDKSGKSHQIIFGAIPVLLGVGSYLAPAPPPGSENTGGIPPAVQNFFNSIAGHQVDSTRVVLSLFLMTVVVVVIGVLVSTSVRRSLTAIGRNPLARASVLRGLAQVVVVALALVAGALGGVYFIATH